MGGQAGERLQYFLALLGLMGLRGRGRERKKNDLFLLFFFRSGNVFTFLHLQLYSVMVIQPLISHLLT